MGRMFGRQEIVERLRKEVSAGRPLFDALVGSGITAKFAEAGGADLITTFILAYYRMQGLSSMAGYLPIGDANAMVLDLGERAILPAVRDTPVLAGLLGADPTRDMARHLEKVAAVGFSGVMNCPTLALIDGKFRRDLEETGMTYRKEVEMIRLAHARGMFTKAFATTVEEALMMVEAGVDTVIAHLGNSSGGSIGSRGAVGLEEGAERIATICRAVKRANPATFTTCHGGALETPEHVGAVLARVPELDGYVGGSSAERFPIEESVTAAARGFKAIARKG
jgi:predicted TIM-barrel enzyme